MGFWFRRKKVYVNFFFFVLWIIKKFLISIQISDENGLRCFLPNQIIHFFIEYCRSEVKLKRCNFKFDTLNWLFNNRIYKCLVDFNFLCKIFHLNGICHCLPLTIPTTTPTHYFIYLWIEFLKDIKNQF